MEAVEALRKQDLNVRGLISIFSYSFDIAEDNFNNLNCEKISLCDYKTLLNEAVKSNYIDKKDIKLLDNWRKDPSKWNR